MVNGPGSNPPLGGGPCWTWLQKTQLSIFILFQTADKRLYSAKQLFGQAVVTPLLKKRSGMDEKGKTIKEKVESDHVAPGEFKDRYELYMKV